jgi:DNA polymerase (family X)
VLIEENRLMETRGVGDAIADIITKLHHTGTHPSLERLPKEIPAGVIEILAVPGLRPDKGIQLYKDLGITSLAELEAAAKDDRIRKAKGLGAALQTKILQNLAIAKSGEGRVHMHRAAALLEHAIATLRKTCPELKRLSVAGDFRRGCELVSKSSLLVVRRGSAQPLFLLFEVLHHLHMMLQCWQRLPGPVFQLQPGSMHPNDPKTCRNLPAED